MVQDKHDKKTRKVISLNAFFYKIKSRQFKRFFRFTYFQLPHFKTYFSKLYTSFNKSNFFLTHVNTVKFIVK